MLSEILYFTFHFILFYFFKWEDFEPEAQNAAIFITIHIIFLEGP
jgi:hypothetical protein